MPAENGGHFVSARMLSFGPRGSARLLLLVQRFEPFDLSLSSDPGSQLCWVSHRRLGLSSLSRVFLDLSRDSDTPFQLPWPPFENGLCGLFHRSKPKARGHRSCIRSSVESL